MRKLKVSAVGLFAVLLLAGCAARPLHPGSANAFDSGSYDSLLVTHSVIETTKQELATGTAFPANIAANVSTALRELITSYNIAQAAYVEYHMAALNGVATTAQSDKVSATLTDVGTKTTALTSAKNGKP